MAAIMTTMAVLNTRCLGLNSPKLPSAPKPAHRPISLLSAHLKGVPASPPPPEGPSLSSAAAGTALSGAVFSALSSCDAALAAQQLSEIAEGSDNRGLALLLPIVPAVAWVLYNILRPALNQINRMRDRRVVAVWAGIGGLATAGTLMVATPEASAAAAAAAGGSDNRGQLLVFVVGHAIAWVLYNILQPGLNQLNRMRSQQ